MNATHAGAPPAPPNLIPDPERIRGRLAELAREQQLLRRMLRLLVRDRQHNPVTKGGPERAA